MNSRKICKHVATETELIRITVQNNYPANFWRQKLKVLGNVSKIYHRFAALRQHRVGKDQETLRSCGQYSEATHLYATCQIQRSRKWPRTVCILPQCLGEMWRWNWMPRKCYTGGSSKSCYYEWNKGIKHIWSCIEIIWWSKPTLK